MEPIVTKTNIISLHARQIFDSRGHPTVEVDLQTELGLFRAAAPSGVTTGAFESIELRDGGERYHGQGVSRAVRNIRETIFHGIKGMDPTQQESIDNRMVQQLDASRNENGWQKKKLGANAVMAVSLAVCKAGAASLGIPLWQHIANLAGNTKVIMPVPSFHALVGGKGVGNKLAIASFQLMPTGANSFSEAMMMGTETYHTLRKLIIAKYGQSAVNVTDEGGFAPPIRDNLEALELLNSAINESGYAKRMGIAIDVASSDMYDHTESLYDLDFKSRKSGETKQTEIGSTKRISGAQLSEIYRGFTSKFPVISIQDPFEIEDWSNWVGLCRLLGETQIVGGTLLSTNTRRIDRGIKSEACNSILLKMNQAGSVWEAITATKMAQEAGWSVIIGQRSGETSDCFIADMCVGLATGQIQAGAPCRIDRIEKYNQLIRIEEELGGDAVYAGEKFRTPMKV
jgi:enolase|tara:strand:- start:204 stop:1574 length:1371 start_codon:yes stop_codon:yes gene_type:complete